MQQVLIDNWNSRIKPEDRVYILGDFVFGGPGKIKEITSKLNGVKILVKGNHDPNKLRKPQFWEDFGFERVVEPNEEFHFSYGEFLLNHYPYRYTADHTPNERFPERRYINRGKWLLHGHSHSPKQNNLERNMIDVGVDANSYFPISLEEIRELATTKKCVNIL